jgi:hypothetical protein
MSTYSIEMDGKGGYGVLVTDHSTRQTRVALTLSTWREAQAWIDDRVKLDENGGGGVRPREPPPLSVS